MLEDKKKNIAIEIREEIEKLNELIEEATKLRLDVDVSQESFLFNNINKPRKCKASISERVEY